jgi:2-haloacid dehalogenase
MAAPDNDSSPFMIRAIAFDAYGTIFDVHSVGVLADRLFPGRGDALAAVWRTKQIDYTRLRTMSQRYLPFSRVTRDALVWSARSLGLALDAESAETLMAEYDRLAVFPDSAEALRVLRGLRMPMAILSNGDPPMLGAVVANGGLDGMFDHLLSVDLVGRFKTAPECYELGPKAFGLSPHEILFVSSNCWDACGAAWFGYTTFWINRAGMPLEELGVVPAATGTTMREVLAFVTTHNAAPDDGVAA